MCGDYVRYKARFGSLHSSDDIQKTKNDGFVESVLSEILAKIDLQNPSSQSYLS